MHFFHFLKNFVFLCCAVGGVGVGGGAGVGVARGGGVKQQKIAKNEK